MGLLDRLRGGTVAHYDTGPRRLDALTAAATILPSGGEEASRALRRRPEWQKEAWSYYDTVGEVWYGCNFVGDALSKVDLYVTREDDPEREPVDNPAALEALEALEPAQAMRNLGINLTVAGEAVLLGIPPSDDTEERWQVVSRDAIEVQSGRYHWAEGAGSGRPLPEGTYLARIWHSHPRRWQVPDSPLRAVLSSCEEILMLERADRAAIRSRTFAGILPIPEELSFSYGDATDTDAPSSFAEALQQAMIAPLQDEGHPSTMVPIIVEGKGELLATMRDPIALRHDLDPTIGERYERSIRRLARGLSVPVEVLVGMADVNHWTAWQIERSTWKAHIEPKAIQIVDALTDVYLQAARLDSGGRMFEGLRVWFDPSPLIAPSPTAEDSHRARENASISEQAYRRRLGFDDDDAPDADPAVTQTLQMITQAPSLAIELGIDSLHAAVEALLAGGEIPPPPSRAAPPGPSGAQGPPETSGVTAAASTANLGDRLADIDRAAFDRLTEVSEAAVDRAVEKAGARIRSKARKSQAATDTLDGADNRQVGRLLGASMVAQLGLEDTELVSDTVAGFRARTRKVLADASGAAAAVAPEQAAAVYQSEAEQDEADAVDWLLAALAGIALAVLFGPTAPPEGEADPAANVPARIIREALARAGGAGRLPAIGRVRDVDVGLKARGVAISARMLHALATLGITERQLRWDYRPAIARNTFPPHQALHGTLVDDPTSERLAAGQGWPAVGHYFPGDHDGCRCLWVPVLAAG